MAIAGAMTTAYRLSLSVSGNIYTERTTFPSDRCTPPSVAATVLRNWTPDAKPPIVQGSDMAAFWAVWNGGE